MRSGHRLMIYCSHVGVKVKDETENDDNTLMSPVKIPAADSLFGIGIRGGIETDNGEYGERKMGSRRGVPWCLRQVDRPKAVCS